MNTAPPTTIDSPLIWYLVRVASRVSLTDQSSYGSALKKFHIFCDIFCVPEAERLPASFEVLHSFAVWAASDPDVIDQGLWEVGELEPVSVQTVRKYLAGIQAWHLAQGQPIPLSNNDHRRIEHHLRGLAKLSARAPFIHWSR